MPAATTRPPRRVRSAGWALVAAGVVVLGGGGVALRSAERSAGVDTSPARLDGAAAEAAARAATTTAAPATTTAATSPAPIAAPSPTNPTNPTRAPRATSTPRTSTTTSTVPVPTTVLSPLAAQVGAAESALPVPPADVAAPVLISVEGIGVDEVPVRAVGVTEDGQLEIPGATEVGWYRLGSSPGRPGVTVLAAHVSWRGSSGPFLRLGDVELGAAVTLILDDLTTRQYVVVERAQYGKLMLPAERVWTRRGPETLVLITCGGDFNPDVRRYSDNIVAYAVPVG